MRLLPMCLCAALVTLVSGAEIRDTVAAGPKHSSCDISGGVKFDPARVSETRKEIALQRAIYIAARKSFEELARIEQRAAYNIIRAELQSNGYRIAYQIPLEVQWHFRAEMAFLMRAEEVTPKAMVFEKLELDFTKCEKFLGEK